MKHLLIATTAMTLCLTAIDSQTVLADEFETAAQAVAHMRVGWNLGNTLDSHSDNIANMWIEAWSQRRPADYETAWGQPVTKPALMKLFKDAGFNAIRVPVTWYPHMEATFKGVKYDSSTNALTPWDPVADPIGTKIKAAWMKRVHEVVDYVISQGLYCILNVHHDTGASNTAWLIATEDDYAKQKERFEEVWRQIAEEFKDYDEHLIFEGYNEMLDPYGSWCFASHSAPGNYNSSVATSAYNAINSYAQSFVNAVRATGGNNVFRNLIVSTYGACNGSGTWSTHLSDPLKQMKLPSDSLSNHLIIEVHSYTDVKDLNAAKSEVNQIMRSIKNYLVPKGAPIIFGEWGTLVENAYTDYHDNLLAYARYFVEQAKANNMTTFYWMGLSDGSHRSVPEFNQADLKDAIIKGYYGEEGYNAIIPLPSYIIHQTSYDLAGRKLSGPQRGLNIIRTTDGQVCKRLLLP